MHRDSQPPTPTPQSLNLKPELKLELQEATTGALFALRGGKGVQDVNVLALHGVYLIMLENSLI